jgi:gliding motility-associated-like protein
VKISAPGKLNLISTADINNDGLLDLIASAALDNDVQIWINKSTPGSFSFNTSQTLTTSIGPWGVNVSDIDGDGDADLVVANKNGAGPQYNAADTKINIFRQDASLTFTRLDIVTATPSRNLRVGDYDGDGKPDIAFSIYSLGSSLNTLTVLRNNNCWNPVISGNSTLICSGQTIKLQTKPALGVTFDWKLGGVSQTLGSPPEVFNATAAGTYTVTLTGTIDASCVNTAPSYTLTANPNPFPSATAPVINNNTPLCVGGTINLTTSAVADSYSWTGPNNFSSSVQNPSVTPISNASAGLYSLQLKMSTGCQSDIYTKVLDVASVPVLPVTASPSATACVGGAVTLTVPSNASYTYQWNKAGSPISGATSTSLSLPSLTAADQAAYTVSVTNTTNLCTQLTGATTVNVYSVPAAAFAFSGTQCVNSTITFTDQSTFDSRGSLTYSWALGDASTSTVQNPTHPYTAASTYSVGLTVSYSGSCTNSTSKSITIYTPVKPTIVASANPICVGDQTTLSVSGTFNSFNWVGATGTTSSVVITQPALYKVNTVDVNGCTSKDSLTINLKPTLSFTAVSKRSQINLGDTTQLIAAGADSYLWAPGKLLTTDSTIANPIAKPTATTAYVVLAKKAGFCSVTDTVKITVEAGSAVIKPPVLFSPNSDGFNDTWQLCTLPSGSGTCPEESTYFDWTMTIYDGHGSQIYQQKGFSSWDGTFNGKPSPNGTYFYVFSNSKDKPATGSVLLVR